MRGALILFCACTVWAQDDPYAALRDKQYDRAIAGFEAAIKLAPEQASLRKDLAYTLLKMGDTAAAREQFGVAVRLDPADDHVALEYAFLAYEDTAIASKQAARRIFERLKEKDPTAATAFENVDKPLREGIARWQVASTAAPENFSAHEELARLAEQRDELMLAADQYQLAWKLRPARRDLLLDLGRVWRDQGHAEQAMAAWVAAWRGGEARVAEAAKALLPARYPYGYEFEQALVLDPANEQLRHDVEYLHREPVPKPDAIAMAGKSLEKGYLRDAARFLESAHESDPMDFGLMLKLGETYNNLHDDRVAMRWFDLARRSPDTEVAEQAGAAYRNLAPSLRRIRTTVWMFPMISTRWRDTFAYAQAKAELKLPGVHPYISVRFVGDVGSRVHPNASFAPEYFSERSAIIGVGVATPLWHGATAWFETGTALHYADGTRELDARGGVSFAKRKSRRMWFAETNDDALYVRRFNRDMLLYAQNRVGRSFGDSVAVYWNGNATVDAKRQYWANTAETGPGVRWRVDGIELSVNFLRGTYLVNRGSPYRPNFNDVRIGLWYAFSH